MDTATSDIRAVEVSPSSDGDSPVLPERLDQIPECQEIGTVTIGTVTANGACDTRCGHSAIIARQATAIIPTRKNGRPWKEDGPATIAGNEALRATRHHGRACLGSAGRDTMRVAASKRGCAASRPRRSAARDPDRQSAETQIRVALMNRFNALGTVEIVRVA